MKNKISTKFIVTVGVVMVCCGIFILSYDYFKSKKTSVYETMNFALTDQPTYYDYDDTNQEEIKSDTEETENGEVFVNQPYFIGRLEIPKINLIKGLASKESKYNDVSKNVAIMSQSTYPDVEKGNFVLAAHAGNAWNSFFANLYQLQIGDNAYVYYKGIKYTYTLVNVYNQDKTGYIKLYRDKEKNVLTLVTCTRGNLKYQQTVYIFELVSKEAE